RSRPARGRAGGGPAARAGGRIRPHGRRPRPSAAPAYRGAARGLPSASAWFPPVMTLLRFVARRLVHVAFVLLGVSLLSFLLLELAPGDFFEELRLSPQVSPE